MVLNLTASSLLTVTDAPLPEPEGIPPQEWLLGDRLARGCISLLAGPGGAGKSTLALAIAASHASGHAVVDETVHHSVPAWLLRDMLHVTAAQAAMMIEAWLNSRVLTPTRWRDGDFARTRPGLAVDNSRPQEPALVLAMEDPCV